MSAAIDRSTFDLVQLWCALHQTPTCIQKRREFYLQYRGRQDVIIVCKKHTPLLEAYNRATNAREFSISSRNIATSNISTCPQCLLERALLADNPSCLLASRPFSFAARLLLQ